jgi:glycosidase
VTGIYGEHIREPFAWTESETAKGQTTWEKQTVSGANRANANVQTETGQENSMLSTYRMLISWRNELPALRDGDLKNVETLNPAILSFLRRSAQQSVLVLHNLSGQPQEVPLDTEDLRFRENN